MEAIFVLLIAPILLVFTDSAVGFAAGAVFFVIGVFYKRKGACRIAAFIASGFWLFMAVREFGSNGFSLGDFFPHVFPTIGALLFSFGTQTCILSKDNSAKTVELPPKTQAHLRYIRQSLRVGIEQEIIIENLIERGVEANEARSLLQSQLKQK